MIIPLSQDLEVLFNSNFFSGFIREQLSDDKRDTELSRSLFNTWASDKDVADIIRRCSL